MKISDEQTQNVSKNKGESRERINSLKTEIPEAGSRSTNEGFDNGENKDKDNASSASTVEVLDDKWTVHKLVITFRIFSKLKCDEGHCSGISA